MKIAINGTLIATTGPRPKRATRLPIAHFAATFFPRTQDDFRALCRRLRRTGLQETYGQGVLSGWIAYHPPGTEPYYHRHGTITVHMPD
jgi:hypothetical protein